MKKEPKFKVGDIALYEYNNRYMEVTVTQPDDGEDAYSTFRGVVTLANEDSGFRLGEIDDWIANSFTLKPDPFGDLFTALDKLEYGTNSKNRG